jgi:hypothetical protein
METNPKICFTHEESAQVFEGGASDLLRFPT